MKYGQVVIYAGDKNITFINTGELNTLKIINLDSIPGVVDK